MRRRSDEGGGGRRRLCAREVSTHLKNLARRSVFLTTCNLFCFIPTSIIVSMRSRQSNLTWEPIMVPGHLMHRLIWGTYLDAAVTTTLTTTMMATATLPEMAKAINCPLRGAPGTHPGGIPWTTGEVGRHRCLDNDCEGYLCHWASFLSFFIFFNLIFFEI